MIKTTLGAEVVYRQWGLSSPRAVFLLVHGLGAHSGRWEAMADFFLTKGISSYAIDFPDPAKAARNSGYFDIYGKSVLELSEIIAAQNPEKKIFIIGESMGALISFLLSARRPASFSGLICLSPAFGSKIKLSVADYLKIAASLFYDSKKIFKLPFDSSMCTRDVDYRNKMDKDPNGYHAAPSRLLLEILLAQRKAIRIKRNIDLPVLFLVAGSDMIADSDITAEIFSAMAAKDKSMIEFPDMYHSLSIELGKEAVFAELLNWVDKRLVLRRN